MEAGSRRGEEPGGEKGAQEGGLLGRSRGALGSAGGGLGGLEDGEEGMWGNNVVFKWAMIDGRGGEEHSGGQPGPGRRSPHPRPRSAIAWLVSRALSLAALSSSFIPSPSAPPLLHEGSSHSLHPCPGFSAKPSSRASHTGKLPQRRTRGKWRSGEAGAAGGAESRGGEGVWPEGPTDRHCPRSGADLVPPHSKRGCACGPWATVPGARAVVGESHPFLYRWFESPQ